jgi:hypothetical protein
MRWNTARRTDFSEVAFAVPVTKKRAPGVQRTPDSAAGHGKPSTPAMHFLTEPIDIAMQGVAVRSI